MQLQHVEVAERGQVSRLSLSGHPLSRREAAELAWLAGELAEDRAVRVVVITSRAPDFCPGPADDLEPLNAGFDPPASLGRLPCPVIAVLTGMTASVGLEVALAADIRIAADGASFRMPDVAAGRLPCWGGTQRLVRTIGRAAALQMLLLGETLEAPDALTRGLVHEVAPASTLSSRVDEMVSTLTALGPLALQYTKEAVYAGAEMPMRDGLRLEGDLNHLLQASTDRAEGLAAFLDKREPGFEGR